MLTKKLDSPAFIVSGIIAQLLFPVAALIHSLSASNSWGQISQVMQGTYEDIFAGRTIAQTLLIISLLGLGYLLCYVAALIIIPKRIHKRTIAIRLLRIVLVVAGSSLLFLSTVVSSYIYIALGDYNILPGIYPPNSVELIFFTHLVVLLAVIFYLFRSSPVQIRKGDMPE